MVERKFAEELEQLINKYSVENASDTPDFILAQYLCDCLNAYAKTIAKRDKWWGDVHWKSMESKEEMHP